MTQEALAPTPERLKRSQWDTPETDAKTQRRAYKERHIFLELLREGKIDGDQYQVSERFHRHMEGAEGHDVRVTDCNGQPNDKRQPARTFHASHFADAKKALSSDEFLAMERLCRGSSTLVQVGFGLSGVYSNRQQATSYAVAVVKGALQRLVDLWIPKQKHPPSR